MTHDTTSNGPESIVVSLEKAKELRAAGYPQEQSCFYWFEHRSMKTHEINRTVLLNNPAGSLGKDSVAAPTPSELWRFMPVGTEMIKKDRATRVTIPCIVPTESGTKSHAEESKHEQDALAAMYIYLASNNLLPKA